MAQNSGFFNAELVGNNYDRVYLAEQFAKYFASFVGNGVFQPDLQVVIISGMNVRVNIGQAFINGYWYENTSNLTVVIPIAHATLPRIDRIVLRLDLTTRQITLIRKGGSAASSPSAPGLTRSSTIYEIALGDVRVNAAVSAITQANITDTRPNASLCGWVTGLIEQFNFNSFTDQFNSFFNQQTTQITTDTNNFNSSMQTSLNNFNNSMNAAQQSFEQEFYSWFNSIKDLISDDALANLLSSIVTLQTNMNGSNILRGSNNIQEAFETSQGRGNWLNGLFATYGSIPSGGTRRIVEVSGLPNPHIKQAIRLATSGNVNLGISQYAVPVQIGAVYTVSCYIKLNSGDNRFVFFIHDSVAGGTALVQRVIQATTTWQRVQMSFTATVASIRVSFVNNLLGSIDIAGFQLEQGNYATDWRPAQDDTVPIGGTNILRNTMFPNIVRAGNVSNGTNNIGNWIITGGSDVQIIINPSVRPPSPTIENVVRITSTNTAQQDSIRQDEVPLTVGQTYVLSFWFRRVPATVNDDVTSFVEISGNTFLIIPLGIAWKRYSYKFIAVTASSSFRLGVRTSFVDTVEICGMKLEVGETSTTVLEHPKDYTSGSNILRNTNNLPPTIQGTQASGEFAIGGWSTFGSAPTRINVSNSPNPDITQGVSTIYQAAGQGPSQWSIPLNTSVLYTLSVYAKVISGDATFLMIVDPNSATGRLISTKVATNRWQRFSMTFAGISDGGHRISFSNSNATGVIEFCGMKLEVGTKATDWSESPWDIEYKNLFTPLVRENIFGTDMFNASGTDIIASGNRLSYFNKPANTSWSNCPSAITNAMNFSGIREVVPMRGSANDFMIKIYERTPIMGRIWVSLGRSPVDWIEHRKSITINMPVGTATNEVLTNEFRGGYRVYRAQRIISIPNSAGTTTVNNVLTGIRTCIVDAMYATNNTETHGFKYHLPYNDGSSNVNIRSAVESNGAYNVTLVRTAGWNGYSVVLQLSYTKTTDTVTV